MGTPATISQRELRNQSSDVLRRVKAGETFVVTNNGEAVARLVPLSSDLPPLPLSRPAKRRGGFTLPTRSTDQPTEDVLDALREERI